MVWTASLFLNLLSKISNIDCLITISTFLLKNTIFQRSLEWTALHLNLQFFLIESLNFIWKSHRFENYTVEKQTEFVKSANDILLR